MNPTTPSSNQRTDCSSSFLDELPAELLCHILSFYAKDSIAQFAQLRLVSRRWRVMVDSSGRFTELNVVDSKISSSAIERRCEHILRPEKILLVGSTHVTFSSILALFNTRRAAHIKEIHIENCSKMTSKDVSLAFLVEQCPNLQKLTFISGNYSREDRVPYSEWEKNAKELTRALALRPKDNPLQLLKTNIILPDKEFLQICPRFCFCLTLEYMPRSPDTTGCFSKGVLALTTDIASEKYYGQGPSYVGQAGWAHAWWADHKRWNRAINLLGHKDKLYYLRDRECLRPPASVTLHQKQLLFLSDDGFASLLDAEGDISEDTLINQQWHALVRLLLNKGEDVWLSFMRIAGRNEKFLFGIVGGSDGFILYED